MNVAIIGMGVVTMWTRSGWPDLVLGFFIILLALHAPREVWTVSQEKRLGARALAGEDIDKEVRGISGRGPCEVGSRNISAVLGRLDSELACAPKDWTRRGRRLAKICRDSTTPRHHNKRAETCGRRQLRMFGVERS